MPRKECILILAMTILLAIVGLTLTAVLAQQEIVPEWTYESGDKLSTVAISADGNYIGVGTSDTGIFYLFRDKLLVWNHTVGNVHSISMSSEGKHIAVGAGSDFYLFDHDNSTPRLKYPTGYENSIVAVSSDGNNAVVGAMPSEYYQDSESKLYLFERVHPIPTWIATLEGVLESLSISEDGNYIVASTSLPGVLHMFSKERKTPLWSFNFGDWSGGTKISTNGDYIIAVGGDKGNVSDLAHWPRVFQFSRQDSTFAYQKAVPELPPSMGLAISSNGSIFVLSYAGENELILFDMNVQPYGPGSIHNMSLPASGVSISMSADGRYTFVGTFEGLFIYEYSENSLNLWKQYTTNGPLIYDLSSSSDGRYVAAVGRGETSGNEQSLVYLFDNIEAINPWTQWTPFLIAISIAAIGTAGFVLYRKTRASLKDRPSEGKSTIARLNLPFYVSVAERRVKET